MTKCGRCVLGAILLCGAANLHPQPASPPLNEQQLQRLANGRQWSAIVSLLEPASSRSALMDYYLGIALAQLGRLIEAQAAFEAGHRLDPPDSRFLVELAGIAFKQKKYALAIHLLRKALRGAPSDNYANDFLGTTYFVEGNLDAALKYWNRVAKPEIDQVSADPVPHLSPALLDHAFAFSPAAQLTLPQLLDSETRVRALGIFPQFHFDLDARADGNFTVIFRSREIDGFGSSRLEALLLFFQGIPFQDVNPGYYNFRSEAGNLTSMLRWDAQKRRFTANFSGPFERSAKSRWQITADLRNENWAIRNGSSGPAPILARFNMRDEKEAFDLASFGSERFRWSVGAEVSHRNFRSVEPGTAPAPLAGPYLTAPMLVAGYGLKQHSQVMSTPWQFPERRFTVNATAASDAGRLWSRPSDSYEKLTGSIGWRWLPQIKGDDYETMQRLYAGHTFGQVPLDELFILGLERDNDLPLRAHIGTRNGRKGSAPLGRNYLLENWESNKNIYGNGIVRVQIGPFFDVGRIADPGTALGSHQWLFDTGGQVKLSVLGVGLVFSYGKDLRTGNNAFYVTSLP